MGFVETAAEAAMARHVLATRDQDEIESAITDRAETMQKALDLAEEDFGGEIPDDVHVSIFMNPQAYIAAEPFAKQEDESVDKEYVGFDAMVEKLKAEGHSEESAKRIASSIGRKKYGAQFGAAASSHH